MVYVDDMEAEFGRMKMCHMFSDTSVKELHEMADNIGIQRKWFQDKPGFPHYDICKSKRLLAVGNGAKEIGYGCQKWCDIVKEMRITFKKKSNG